MPRSGTSWVGAVLGSANNALYLREPVTQGRRLMGPGHPTIQIDPNDLPIGYEHFADNAFAAIPQFPERVVFQPEQWSLFSRRRRRLVIKEVNPLACDWYVSRYGPRVVLLVRHPAAVAASYVQMRWCSLDLSELEAFGARYGDAYTAAVEALKDANDSLLISYEDLCLDPLARFGELFATLGLDWDTHAKRLVQSHSSGETAESGPYSTHRESRVMRDAWRTRLTVEQAHAVRRGYESSKLPWYTEDADW